MMYDMENIEKVYKYSKKENNIIEVNITNNPITIEPNYVDSIYFIIKNNRYYFYDCVFNAFISIKDKKKLLKDIVNNKERHVKIGNKTYYILFIDYSKIAEEYFVFDVIEKIEEIKELQEEITNNIFLSLFPVVKKQSNIIKKIIYNYDNIYKMIINEEDKFRFIFPVLESFVDIPNKSNTTTMLIYEKTDEFPFYKYKLLLGSIDSYLYTFNMLEKEKVYIKKLMKNIK